MKSIEEQLKSALHRERSINENKFDPGPDWEEAGLFHYMVVGIACFFMLKTLISS